MKIIVRPRRQGKTTTLIRLAALHGGTIVVHSEDTVRVVQRLAEKMCIEVPVISFGRFLQGALYGTANRNVWFDNAELILADLAHRNGGRMDGMTTTPSYGVDPDLDAEDDYLRGIARTASTVL